MSSSKRNIMLSVPPRIGLSRKYKCLDRLNESASPSYSPLEEKSEEKISRPTTKNVNKALFTPCLRYGLSTKYKNPQVNASQSEILNTSQINLGDSLNAKDLKIDIITEQSPNVQDKAEKKSNEVKKNKKRVKAIIDDDDEDDILLNDLKPKKKCTKEKEKIKNKTQLKEERNAQDKQNKMNTQTCDVAMQLNEKKEKNKEKFKGIENNLVSIENNQKKLYIETCDVPMQITEENEDNYNKKKNDTDSEIKINEVTEGKCSKKKKILNKIKSLEEQYNVKQQLSEKIAGKKKKLQIKTDSDFQIKIIEEGNNLKEQLNEDIESKYGKKKNLQSNTILDSSIKMVEERNDANLTEINCKILKETPNKISSQIYMNDAESKVNNLEKTNSIKIKIQRCKTNTETEYTSRFIDNDENKNKNLNSSGLIETNNLVVKKNKRSLSLKKMSKSTTSSDLEYSQERKQSQNDIESLVASPKITVANEEFEKLFTKSINNLINSDNIDVDCKENLAEQQDANMIKDVNGSNDRLKEMQTIVEGKRKRLEKLKNESIEEIKRNTNMWKLGCQTALTDLLTNIRKRCTDCDMTLLLKNLNIDPKLVNYSIDDQIFI